MGGLKRWAHVSVSKPNHFSGQEYVSVAVLDYINRVAVIWMTVYPGGT